jgi:flagellar motor switch protein FliG
MEAFSALMQERLQELAELVSTEENVPALSLETLLDTFMAVYTDCKLATNQNDQIAGFLQKCIAF